MLLTIIIRVISFLLTLRLRQTNLPKSKVLLHTRLPVTRWVKLSLNFELPVKRAMKFLLGQRLFNNIFCTI